MPLSPRYVEGVRSAAPIAVASFAFGASFGVLAGTAGLGWLAPIVMSATTFAGSGQLAATSVLEVGGTVAAAVTDERGLGRRPRGRDRDRRLQGDGAGAARPPRAAALVRLV